MLSNSAEPDQAALRSSEDSAVFAIPHILQMDFFKFR